MSFVHLHVRSHFSRLAGAAAPDALVARAVACKMPALALTDLLTLAGAVPFYQVCHASGVQPILGIEVRSEAGDALVLLARDRSGYRSLCRIASALGLQRPAGGRPPACTLDLLRVGRDGLIAVAGGRRGRIAEYVRADDGPRAAHLIGTYATLFGTDNFFLELVRHEPSDAGLVSELARLAGRLGVATVVTNDALCSVPEDAPTVALLDAIRTGTTLAAPHAGKSDHSPQRYLKTAGQMAELFADYPEALAATRFIARRCELELPLGALRFPGVELPSGETAFSALWKLCFAGATQRYRPLTAEVTARLQYELQIIGALGFAPYFLIVYDIVHWARRHEIPIWGRGSAADSLVSYLLEITSVDPLAHGLYFERFLHAERDPADPPDIDLDICWRGRDAVLNYVYEQYGRDKVAMMGTHICFGLRSAWRDVAKAHGLPAEEVAVLGGRPWGYDLGEAQDEASASAAREAVPRGAEDDAWGRIYPPAAETGVYVAPEGDIHLDPAVLAGCEALDGRPRDLGIHCGGIVVAPFSLTDEVPLQLTPKGIAVTSYDMHAIAALGLTKIDLLGSRALGALAAIVARVRADGTPLDLDAIPQDDPATLAMMAAGATVGCFQLESPGMRALLQIMRPRGLDDLTAAVSLFRPGPLEGGLKDTFLKRLRSGEQPEYPHPAMEEILAETHGVILYQEQFLRLVHELAGLDLAAAEQMRKWIAKAPGPDVQGVYRAAFIAGAIGNDISRPVAEQIWDILMGYSGFGFCKGHAASYAVIAYRMAYCKAHYPAELLAAVLDNVAGFYPPTVYIEEARRLGIELLGPDVNASATETLARRRSVQIGLGAVRGLRRDTLDRLLASRRELGPFRSLRDLLLRVPMSKSEITALIQVGALDHLLDEQTHPALVWMAHLWLPVIARGREVSAPSGATYPLPLQEPLPELPPEMPPLQPYSRAEVLAFERQHLGFTVSDNPLAPYVEQLARYGALPARELAAHGGESVVAGGFVVAARRHLTRGGWMLFLTMQDQADLLEVVVMPDIYQAAGAVVAAGGPLVVRGLAEIAAHGGAVVRALKLRSLRPPDPAQSTFASLSVNSAEGSTDEAVPEPAPRDRVEFRALA